MKGTKNTVKRLLPMLLIGCLLLGTAGCGTQNTAVQDTQDGAAETAVKPVILVTSFGTSFNDSREKTIGAIEDAIQKANPDYEVRRAFTSQIIIDKLAQRDNLKIDNVTEAMERLVADGVKELVVQPTHVMPGFEYDDVVKEVEAYKDKFDSVKFGEPLLSSDADFDALVKVLAEETAAYNAEDTAIVFMGHGTEHAANATYAKLQEKMTAAGYANYFVGTVEAEPSLDDVIALLKATTVKKVVLLPLMVVAGDHANNDMAGDEDNSWKTILTNEGFEVECVLKGMGEYKGVQDIYADHAAAALAQ